MDKFEARLKFLIFKFLIVFCFWQRLLVVEFLSVGCESSMINKFDWKDELYTGEFDDLSVCNLYAWETSEPVFPSLQVSKSDVPTARSNHQPNHEIMQV